MMMITTSALSMRIIVLLLIVICNCCITMLNSMNLNYNLFFRRLSSASYPRHDHHHLTDLTNIIVGEEEILVIPFKKETADQKGDALIDDTSFLSADVKLISTDSPNTRPSNSSNKHITGNELLC